MFVAPTYGLLQAAHRYPRRDHQRRSVCDLCLIDCISEMLPDQECSSALLLENGGAENF